MRATTRRGPRVSSRSGCNRVTSDGPCQRGVVTRRHVVAIHAWTAAIAASATRDGVTRDESTPYRTAGRVRW